MAGLTAKDREALSYLYELPEFRAFKKLCANKRQKVAELIIGQDMSEIGSDKKVAMLQGQAYSLEMLLLEFQNIHKRQMKLAEADTPKR